MRRLAFLALALALPAPLVAQPAPQAAIAESAAVEALLTTYDRALAEQDLPLLMSILGDTFVMFNGAHSGDPAQWEAHLYLDKERMQPWFANFIRQAGPHANRVRLLGANARGGLIVATTENTGSNKFRSWTDERVTWLIGRKGEGWALLGFFIADIRNPG